MKHNMEFEREDIRVDRDIQIDSENKLHIVAYLETLFDVNKKFNLQLDSEAGEWVNMYGIYNPASDFLTIECVICKDDSSKSFFYTPTKEEAKLIKDMIAEKIQEGTWSDTRGICLRPHRTAGKGLCISKHSESFGRTNSCQAQTH